MKNFKDYKDKLIKTYKDLNNIDINSIYEQLKNTNFSDIKKLETKNIINFIKESQYAKTIISFIVFFSFFYFLLIPNIKIFTSKYKLSRQYMKEARNLSSLNNDLINIKKKYKKINYSIKEIQSSIIDKDKLIYLTNLFDELSKSTAVRIDLFAPINNTKEESICKISEINQLSKNELVKKNKSKLNKEVTNAAIYELKLYGSYLNIISFLNSIQNYDLMIIANCIQVDKENSEEIIDSGVVKANLILKLPVK